MGDPCCAWSGCDIFQAVWDSGLSKWCWKDDFSKNGNTCGDDYWTGGFLYDHCPCSGDDTYNCGNGERQRCIADATSGWTPDSWMLGQCSQGRDVCYGGMILAAYSDLVPLLLRQLAPFAPPPVEASKFLLAPRAGTCMSWCLSQNPVSTASDGPWVCTDDSAELDSISLSDRVSSGCSFSKWDVSHVPR